MRVGGIFMVGSCCHVQQDSLASARDKITTVPEKNYTGRYSQWATTLQNRGTPFLHGRVTSPSATWISHRYAISHRAQVEAPAPKWHFCRPVGVRIVRMWKKHVKTDGTWAMPKKQKPQRLQQISTAVGIRPFFQRNACVVQHGWLLSTTQRRTSQVAFFRGHFMIFHVDRRDGLHEYLK